MLVCYIIYVCLYLLASTLPSVEFGLWMCMEYSSHDYFENNSHFPGKMSFTSVSCSTTVYT